MRKFFWSGLIVIGVLALILGLDFLNFFTPERSTSSLIVQAETPSGFQRAEGPREWNFPTDYGPHPDYQTEWWYYTGNLESETGARFGYQLTIFRRALLPKEERTKRKSPWATDQVYMAHFALSDIASREHVAFERFARGAAGLAGAQSDPYQVWLENWQVVQIDENHYRLIARQDDISLDLILEDIKGPVLHGDQGYSQKGPHKGNASYYHSQTRLKTSGRVQTLNDSYQVSGLSWMDHEFSTSALSPGQVGWDWFSIQLDDSSEIMVYQIRRSDGSIDPFSSGTWISPTGKEIHLEHDQFLISVEDTWHSPNTGAEYPDEWILEIPSLDLRLNITPYITDQEMNVSFNYWEGAVGIDGTSRRSPISGSGYVEMTGYAESIEGEF